MKRYFIIPKAVLLMSCILLIAGCSKNPPSDSNGSAGNGSGNSTNPTLTVSHNTVSFPAIDSTYSITVTSNISWSVTDDQSWISTSASTGNNNGVFNIVVSSNTSSSARSGIITVSASNLTRTVAVLQAGAQNNDGVTLMRGTNATSLYYDYTSHGELSTYLSQGNGTSVRLLFDSNALIRTKLINAELGTMTATPLVSGFGYTRYEINFSNTNNYANSGQEGNPDTTGKLQIWIYREDGQNIMPASGGHPAVKRIVQVPGRFPTMPVSVGLVRLLDYDFAGYPVHPPAITVSSLQNIFATARWNISVNQFTWPW